MARTKRGPIFYVMVRNRLQSELREAGMTFSEARHAVDDLTDDVVDSAVGQVDDTPEGVGAVYTIGDGKLLSGIFDFLQSEQGQALIALLLKVLLGA